MLLQSSYIWRDVDLRENIESGYIAIKHNRIGQRYDFAPYILDGVLFKLPLKRSRESDLVLHK